MSTNGTVNANVTDPQPSLPVVAGEVMDVGNAKTGDVVLGVIAGIASVFILVVIVVPLVRWRRSHTTVVSRDAERAARSYSNRYPRSRTISGLETMQPLLTEIPGSSVLPRFRNVYLPEDEGQPEFTFQAGPMVSRKILTTIPNFSDEFSTSSEDYGTPLPPSAMRFSVSSQTQDFPAGSPEPLDNASTQAGSSRTLRPLRRKPVAYMSGMDPVGESTSASNIHDPNFPGIPFPASADIAPPDGRPLSDVVEGDEDASATPLVSAFRNPTSPTTTSPTTTVMTSHYPSLTVSIVAPSGSDGATNIVSPRESRPSNESDSSRGSGVASSNPASTSRQSSLKSAMGREQSVRRPAMPPIPESRNSEPGPGGKARLRDSGMQQVSDLEVRATSPRLSDAGSVGYNTTTPTGRFFSDLMGRFPSSSKRASSSTIEYPDPTLPAAPLSPTGTFGGRRSTSSRYRLPRFSGDILRTPTKGRSAGEEAPRKRDSNPLRQPSPPLIYEPLSLPPRIRPPVPWKDSASSSSSIKLVPKIDTSIPRGSGIQASRHHTPIDLRHLPEEEIGDHPPSITIAPPSLPEPPQLSPIDLGTSSFPPSRGPSSHESHAPSPAPSLAALGVKAPSPRSKPVPPLPSRSPSGSTEEISGDGGIS